MTHNNEQYGKFYYFKVDIKSQYLMFQVRFNFRLPNFIKKKAIFINFIKVKFVKTRQKLVEPVPIWTRDCFGLTIFDHKIRNMKIRKINPIERI